MTLQALFVDTAAEDGITPAQFRQLVAAGYPWAGVALQCSNGLGQAGAWFNASWASTAGFSVGERYGNDWFRIAYHYFVVGQSSIQQADVALSAVEAAGGWGDGDLWFGCDVERGEQPADVSKAQLEDGVSEFAGAILRRTGKRPLLYAGSYTRGLGITDRMGCALLWFPQWSSSLNWSTVVAMGWTMETTLLWQCAGNKPATVPGYPTTTPIGPQDFSILVRSNLPAAQGVEWVRTHTGSQPT